MSALEFIAAIKWPVTVLLLAAMATVLLKRNPDTRQSVGTWFSRRNLRVNLAGQEFEATVAETQDSIGAAASPDSELAEAVAGTPVTRDETDSEEQSKRDQEVENARRSAVAAVARNAVRLGWQWGRGEHGAREPVTAVSWDKIGQPTVNLLPRPMSAVDLQSWMLNQNLDITMAEVRRVLAQWKKLQSSGETSDPTAHRPESGLPDER